MRAKQSVIFLVLVLGCSPSLQAERVGFGFTGNLAVPGSGNITLFGVSVPRTSQLSGTFSYDTAMQGLEIGPGIQAYPQTISGGYTLSIHGGAIRLNASDYLITVTNDTGSPPADTFSLEYDYDSAAVPPRTPEKIWVNGSEWTGPRAFLRMELSWDPSTFMDTELTADRPLAPDPGIIAAVGSSGTPRLITVTSISPIVPVCEDYNRSGVLESSDYIEWRKAFGQSLSYADGNEDGLVDAADYVVWRKAATSVFGSGAARGSEVASVPEPAAFFTAITGLLLLSGKRLR